MNNTFVKNIHCCYFQAVNLIHCFPPLKKQSGPVLSALQKTIEAFAAIFTRTGKREKSFSQVSPLETERIHQ
jgi:hypothetical protein